MLAATGAVPSHVFSKELVSKINAGKGKHQYAVEAKQVFLQKALCLYVYVDLGHGNILCSVHSYMILRYRC